MKSSIKALAIAFGAWLMISNCFLVVAGGGYNYTEALTKSLLFLEAQRSGKLPPNSRIPWRAVEYDIIWTTIFGIGTCSCIENVVDLVGGYYDAGDNVKYGLPMAFTITTLAWSALAYKSELEATGELKNVHAAIRWGTDYFLKASSKRNKLWVQVGDPNADHACWLRPENMKTPRTLYKIDENDPGTEIAAETAAAMAASSIVFRGTDRKYARSLLNKAKLDELLWAASWLYMATKRDVYRNYITGEAITASVAEFSWDLKYAGAQVLLSDVSILNLNSSMDYLLGSNPRGRSYMVGFGKNSPTQAHHRGASVPVLSPQAEVDCGMSFVKWYQKNQPNPNELTGAIVGGPDRYDNFEDLRSDSSKLEPCTYINSLAVGPLAKLAVHGA
ncbi:hypothetical protein COCNU_03G004230 [Cocos nucifera]|uniref:Endoglucanase n=1 Tax=Cocos nucifera TaxID=13894 RepID=A0A8K0MYF1_COCNU|nr:hypothetical protein COCNU_03G004230 [Cocos nucifera]